MGTMIQIRNVPPELHRRLKMLAAEAGKSLSDFLLAEVRVVAGRPSLEATRNHLVSREPVEPKPRPAAALRAERAVR